MRTAWVTLAMLLSVLIPRQVSAQYSGAGAGTADDPYLIFNPV